jgi:hypothetical protein
LGRGLEAYPRQLARSSAELTYACGARRELRYLPGFERAAAQALAANPVGRSILDSLRDEDGRLELPDFYVSDQTRSSAWHEPGLYRVAIASSWLDRRGWSVESLSASPLLQGELAREIAPTLAHELVHSVQYRRSNLFRDPFSFLRATLESEYEAELTEQLFIHEALRADPVRPLAERYLVRYEEFLKDPERELRGLDRLPVYQDHVRGDAAAFQSNLQRFESRLPRLQKEGYALLARRQSAGGASGK